MTRPLIDINTVGAVLFPKKRGKHGTIGRCCKPKETYGGKTLRRSEWAKEVGLGPVAWYERKKKFLDPNIDFTEEDLLAPPRRRK